MLILLLLYNIIFYLVTLLEGCVLTGMRMFSHTHKKGSRRFLPLAVKKDETELLQEYILIIDNDVL